MKESNTLGRRIQEGRKAAGLSQEALGERLGVSRQAVSKWEADAAIPELENLIAMSRVFGLSIGELLGVEPPEEQESPAERETPAAEADSGLTEKELAAVEAIAAKYVEETQRRQRPLWSSGSSRVTLSGLDLRIESAVTSAYPLDLSPEAVDLCLYRNQETEPEQVIPVTEAVPAFQKSGYTQMYNASDYQTSFDLSKGDTMVAAVCVTDDHGQTTWKVLNAFRFVGGLSDPVKTLNFGGTAPWVPGASIL